MNDLIMETSMATPQKINPTSPPAQNANHLAALKAAMVMGPTPKSEVKSPEQTNSFSTSTINSTTTTAASTTSTAASSSTPITTTTTIVTPSKPTITTTVTIKSSSNTVVKEEKPSAPPMEAKGQIILNPPKATPNNNNSVNNNKPGSAAGPTIGNLIAGMDAIRQEAINSDKQITSTSAVSSSTSGGGGGGGAHPPVGKDVSTVIGRIEQVKGLTTTNPMTTTTITTTTAGAAAAATTTPAPIPRSRINLVKPAAAGAGTQAANDGEKTAHESSVGSRAAATTATPPSKTENSSRSRATSARAARGASATTTTASHKVTSTVSETTNNNSTATEGHRKSPTKHSAPFTTYTRPATTSSSTRTSSAARGISNNHHNDTTTTSSKIKTTKSYSAIKTHPKMGDAAAAGDSAAATGPAEKATLKDQFAAFSRFGDTSSDGKQISLTNSDKWMKQAGVIGPKSITTTDTSIYFKKLFKTAKKVSFEDYKKFLEDLAASKKIEVQEIHDKMINCGHPATSSATKAAHAGVVERLTDTSKYTGSHKERFDSTGRGRGIDGRRDTKDSSGYTAAFKSKLGTDGKNGSSSPSPTPPSK